MNDDHEPSTQADVRLLLNMLDAAQTTLQHVSRVNRSTAVEGAGRVLKKDENDDAGIPEVFGRMMIQENIGEGFFSHDLDRVKDQRNHKIMRKMTFT